MALQQETSKRGNSVQTLGPSMAASDLPANPSDEIFAGRAIPVRPAVSHTVRRPFSCITKNPLHYCEGPGTDELEGGNRMEKKSEADSYNY